VKVFGDPEGIGILDETGFLKKGEFSVGVQRQYTGTAGKIANCQVGVFLAYVTSKGHALLDRRLYLPKVWCEDAPRREHAKVPESVRFQTKPEQGIEMLKQAWERGVPMRYVVGDEIYGNSTALRDTIAASGRVYVLSVASRVWAAPLTAQTFTEACSVKETIAALPPEVWERRSVGAGSKGERFYDWAFCRVRELRNRHLGPEVWLLARRSVSEPTEMAYYFSNAPADFSRQRLAEIASSRFAVEQCFEEAKAETGLDEYEARHWHCWYRHITLSMMAHAWLASIRLKVAQKRGS
jgi:SRSO17 transposase